MEQEAPGRSSHEVRMALRLGFEQARLRTDEVFALLRDEALLERPVQERHRLIFYLGHLEAFDANLISRDSLGLPPVDDVLDHLFAFGIDPLDGALPADEPSDWPRLEQVLAYRARARARVDSALAEAPLEGSVPWLEDGWCAALAIEHRLMHAETLAYLVGQLPHEMKQPASPPVPDDTHAPDARWIDIPEGDATVGLSRTSRPREGWDNEYGAHRVHVAGFRMAARDVTNAEHLRFVLEGGYQERSLWTEDDWQWLRSEDVGLPAAWVRRGDAIWWRGMHGDVPLPLAWPAWMSHAEASAHARWMGKRLPTEDEYQRAAFGMPDGSERTHPWGEVPPSAQHGVFDFARFEPAPVASRPLGDSAWGVSDLVGNGWKWTSTPFAPLTHFEALPFYPGYSVPFFDGRHFVLKGAGPRTAARLVRPSFRNWFQPHYRHAHAALRLVEDAAR